MKWSDFKTLDDVTNTLTNTLNESLKIKFPDILLSDHEVVSNQVIERNSLKGTDIFVVGQ